jgi:hypothetical protein
VRPCAGHRVRRISPRCRDPASRFGRVQSVSSSRANAGEKVGGSCSTAVFGVSVLAAATELTGSPPPQPRFLVQAPCYARVAQKELPIPYDSVANM